VRQHARSQILEMARGDLRRVAFFLEARAADHRVRIAVDVEVVDRAVNAGAERESATADLYAPSSRSCGSLRATVNSMAIVHLCRPVPASCSCGLKSSSLGLGFGPGMSDRAPDEETIPAKHDNAKPRVAWRVVGRTCVRRHVAGQSSAIGHIHRIRDGTPTSDKLGVGVWFFANRARPDSVEPAPWRPFGFAQKQSLCMGEAPCTLVRARRAARALNESASTRSVKLSAFETRLPPEANVPNGWSERASRRP